MPIQLRDANGNLVAMTAAQKLQLLTEIGGAEASQLQAIGGTVAGKADLASVNGKQDALTGASAVPIPEYTKGSLSASIFGIPQGIPMPVKRGAAVLAFYDLAANCTAAGGGTSTIADDTTDPLVGASSVKVSWASSSVRAITPIAANCPFISVGIDVTGKNIEARLQRQSTSTQTLGNTLAVRLYSSGSPTALPADYHQASISNGAGEAAINDDWITY